MQAYRVGFILCLIGLMLVGAAAQNSSVVPGGASIAPLVIEDANNVSQRNGTNKQHFQVFATFTDASNYGKLFIGSNDDGTRWGIVGEGAGTGSAYSDTGFRIGGVYNGAGGFSYNANQTVEIGAYTLSIGAGGAPNNLRGGGAELQVEVDTGWARFTERTAPSAPAANAVLLYAEDNGSGKTRLMARFATGAAQQVAIEP